MLIHIINRIKKSILDLASTPAIEKLSSRVIKILYQLNPELRHRCNQRNGFIFPLDVGKSVEDMIDEIPSETSLDERRWLYHFFSKIWSGKKNIIELGPFLGGTTRAIALGMCNNPNMQNNAKLYTFDRFFGYYDLGKLSNYLHPLVEAGVLEESDISSIGSNAEFMDVFIKIHSPHDYYQRIVPTNNAVPDRVEDLSMEESYIHLANDTYTDAIFIDGCKSWFGTKYFLKEICKVASPGAFFIFQDYCWYTCFWIPAFVELLKDYFRLFGHVDTTYVFILTKHLTANVIDKLYPDKPKTLGEDKLINIFEQRIEEATSRNDYFAIIRHKLQMAGALAYIGKKSKSKDLINSVKKDPFASSNKKMIESALISPTYSPDGPILL